MISLFLVFLVSLFVEGYGTYVVPVICLPEPSMNTDLYFNSYAHSRDANSHFTSLNSFFMCFCYLMSDI